MFIHKPDPLAPLGGAETPESVALNRRAWLKRAALGVGLASGAGGAWALANRFVATDEQVLAGGQAKPLPEQLAALYPALHEDRFQYDRPETVEAAAARYTNFYEFSSFKSNWRRVAKFQPAPWTLTVTGLCRRPIELDLDDFLWQFRDELLERQYRHRCVETWAMAIPWTGIPLGKIIAAADPLPTATHVKFVSFNRPDQAPGMSWSGHYPWPYTEGLTLPEAVNELTLLATGMYGHPLLKQHGAPIRLVVPWKYGYKSIKSIERIELVASEPATFWNTLAPSAYPFQSNVEPDVSRPWPQDMEWMLGTEERFPTLLYNGYADYVAMLYPQRRPTSD